MTKFPNFCKDNFSYYLKKDNFSYYLKHEWPYHALFNRGLTDVFKCDKEHADPKKTEVKFLLVDSAYSAGLRRWFKRCRGNDGKLPGCIIDNTSSKKCTCRPIPVFINLLYTAELSVYFKNLMKQTSELGGTLNSNNIEPVIKYHKCFGDLLSQRIRPPTNNSHKSAETHSFCSKYLWFHAGCFPVYDRYARVGLKCLQKRGTPTYKAYSEYARVFLCLLEHVFPNECSNFTSDQIKMLDAYLVWIGSDKSRMEVSQ